MEGMGGFFSSVRAAAKKTIHLRKGRIHVISHYDADGLSSALQLASSLRNFPNFSITIVKQMNDEVVDMLNEENPDLVILSDLGSSFEGTENIEPYTIILDHHTPYEFRKTNLVHINPVFYGNETFSASSVVYLFCKEIGFEREDLALIGVAGDMRPLEGVNMEIAREGMEKGLVKKEKVPRMFGIRTWDIAKALSMSGLVEMDESSIIQMLSEAGLRLDKMKSYYELSDEEKKKVVEEVMLWRARNGLDTNILEERLFAFGYSINELSTIFNSAGRMGKTSDIFQWFISGENSILDSLIAEYRKIISNYLSIVDSGGIVKSVGDIFLLDGTEEIDENFVGTISSILSHTKGWKNIIGLGDGGENIKISMRSSEFDSKAFLDEITKDIGIAGGHKEAAGGYVPKIYKDMLVERIMNIARARSINPQ